MLVATGRVPRRGYHSHYTAQEDRAMITSSTDSNRVIVIGENPFLRLSATDEGSLTTDASFWRVIESPVGEGHVLYIKSELAEGEVRIYSDNIGMARWLQETVQGMLNP